MRKPLSRPTEHHSKRTDSLESIKARSRKVERGKLLRQRLLDNKAPAAPPGKDVGNLDSTLDFHSTTRGRDFGVGVLTRR